MPKAYLILGKTEKKSFATGQSVRVLKVQGFVDHKVMWKKTAGTKRYGTIVEVTPGMVHVEVGTTGKIIIFHYGAYRPSPGQCLEIIPAKKLAAASPIKVGDRVRMVKHNDGRYGPADEGIAVGPVIHVGNMVLLVNFPRQYGYAISPKKVEKLPDVKVGDKLRCISTGYTTPEKSGGAGWEDGKEFVVHDFSPDGTIVFPRRGAGVYIIWTEPVDLPDQKSKPESAKEDKKLLIKKRTPRSLGKHEILGQKKIQEQLEIAVDLDMSVLLVGDTGTGKTTIVKEVAERHKREWIRFNLTGETTVDEFVGKYVLQDRETVWEDGVLLTAMKTGKWLVVDEVNVALPEILFVLHSLLDDDRSVMVSNHNGEVVKPHKDFRFFGTMNPVDEYAGTKDLNKAFKSRFGMILNMEYPAPKVEAEIVEGKGKVPYEMATQIVDVAVKIRQAKEKNKVFYTCSTRDIIQWASLVEKLGLVDAFEVSLLNKANGDRAELVKILGEVTQKHLDTHKEGYILNIDYLIDQNIQLHEARKDYDQHRAATEERIKEELLTKLMKDDKAKVKKDA